MRILYSLLIHLYGFSIRIASLFSEKARQWIAGRRELFEKLQQAISTKRNVDDSQPSPEYDRTNLQPNIAHIQPRTEIRNPHSEIRRWIWFHAASLGEFEQGRPLIEHIRQRHQEYRIMLTFFSPSGYLIRKDYKGADYVTYIPLDTARNARRFIEIVNPSIVVFIKYEIWYHHLLQLEKRHIPTFLISAQLRKSQIYFNFFGGFLHKRLERLQQIFTQTAESATMLRQKGFTNIINAGDTRVDRVLAMASTLKELDWLRDCLGNGIILVAGSTWPQDEQRLIPAIVKTGVKCIIAPHEISEDRLHDLERQFPEAKRYSKLKQHPEKTDIVIVDTIGDLGHLYSLGGLAYVGGGFGPGIHNILEPAAYGIPVIIGPNNRKFVEAHALIELGAVRSVRSVDELIKAIQKFCEAERVDEIRALIGKYMDEQRGATERIYQVMKGWM